MTGNEEAKKVDLEAERADLRIREKKEKIEEIFQK